MKKWVQNKKDFPSCAVNNSLLTGVHPSKSSKCVMWQLSLYIQLKISKFMRYNIDDETLDIAVFCTFVWYVALLPDDGWSVFQQQHTHTHWNTTRRVLQLPKNFPTRVCRRAAKLYRGSCSQGNLNLYKLCRSSASLTHLSIDYFLLGDCVVSVVVAADAATAAAAAVAHKPDI